MAGPVGHVLEYSRQTQRPLGRVWRWASYGLTAVPAATVASIYMVYACEWFVNGERPIPPHHGPGNRVEDVLYCVSAVLLLLFLISIPGGMILPIVALGMGRSRSTLLLFLPALTWLASFVLLAADPIGAMDFWID